MLVPLAVTHLVGFFSQLTLLCFHRSECGQGDVPTFYTCDEGLSALTQEGQATLERLEGMLAQSAAQHFHMAGVRTEDNKADFEGWSSRIRRAAPLWLW